MGAFYILRLNFTEISIEKVDYFSPKGLVGQQFRPSTSSHHIAYIFVGVCFFSTISNGLSSCEKRINAEGLPPLSRLRSYVLVQKLKIAIKNNENLIVT